VGYKHTNINNNIYKYTLQFTGPILVLT